MVLQIFQSQENFWKWLEIKSVIHDQLIAGKEKQKALQKKKEEDLKRVNDEKKEIGLRIRY